MTDVPRDPRPRPKYGEYATPQEQAAIIAKSMPPVSPLLTPGDHGESVPVPSGAVEEQRANRETDAAPAPARRRWDLILSVGLLLIGLWNVLGSFVQFSDVPAVIQQAYDTQGLGEYTATAAAGTAGTILIVANVVLLAAAAWITVRRLMANKLAFWIPLVAGVIALLITAVALGAVIVADPAFMQYLQDAN